MVRYNKGANVEVFNKREDPIGSWWPAEILNGNGHTYLVRYYRYPEDGSAVERVPRKAMRPFPTPVEIESWKAGDIVEVFSNFSWKLAEILGVIDASYFSGRFLGTLVEFQAHSACIRAQQTWKDDIWLVIPRNSGECDKTTNELLNEGNFMSQPCLGGNNAGCHHMTGVAKKRSINYLTYGTCAGAANKAVKIEEGGNSGQLGGGGAELLRGKVDAVVSSHEGLGEKFMHTPNTNHNSRYRANLKPCESVGSNSPHRSSDLAPKHDLVPNQEGGSDDFEISSVRESSFPSKGSLAHELDLNAYRSALGAFYVSGSISWNQESVLTNLRLKLHISNDEHLRELRNFKSTKKGPYWRPAKLVSIGSR